MLKAKYGWNVAFPETVPDGQIFGCILKNRGINDVERFFSMGKESLLDPFLFDGMKTAVARVIKALSAKERILIYGDYDCDGISAIAVLYRALKRAGADVTYDLPDRFSDGYGLSMRAVEDIRLGPTKLVITVDNGITCFEEIDKLISSGIDVIVTDHHELIGPRPHATAILHAKTAPEYPFKDLAGVGVAYKLASAVLNDPLDDLLDLVMIGTVADLVPLVGENQAIVNLGLAQLKQTVNPGLQKLLQYSHLDQINETAIAFKIAPKINSSGRLGKAMDAVRLLVSDSDEEINRLILEIEASHVTRKDLTDEAYRRCERLVDLNNNVLVLAEAGLHEGVIGICAQKIAEKYQKTTCVFCLGEDGIGKGSMRSYGRDDILGLLNQCADLLLRYGGHAQAAGLAIQVHFLPQFQERLNAISAPPSHPILTVDMKVSLSRISTATVKKLERYSFFTGLFLFSGLEIVSKLVMSGKHTKLIVSDGLRNFEAISFNNLEYFYRLETGDVVDIVGGLSLNSWRGSETIQIMIKDLSCGHFQVLDLRNQTSYSDAMTDLKRVENALILDDAIAVEGFDLPGMVAKMRPSTIVIGYSTRTEVIDRVLNKDGIGSLYRLIQRNRTLSIGDLARLSENPGWVVAPVVQIFGELNLASVAENAVSILETSEKRNLAESPTYRHLMAVRQQVDFLSNESLKTIKNYFVNLMEA